MTSYDVNLSYGVDNTFSLHGKVIAVTGGLGGIAMATNRLYLEKGAKVAVIYPPFEQERVSQASEVLSAIAKDAVSFHCCDITQADQVDSTFDQIIEEHGKLDGLVNCAGYVMLQPALEVTAKEWQKQLDVNLTGSFLCAKAAANIFIQHESGGKIINIASQAATIAIDQHVAYTSAKAGLIGMTKVLALEWAKHKINVNTISPTVVLTPMGEKAWQGEKGEHMKQKIPMGRFAYTDEIAAAILFFTSNGSDMITGADLMIDGGFTIF
ncbi:GolD/DthD family dehydrogenase [Vibrio nigripulchritudo]|uniref:GolD/DthD family dehydrogenase n=1 Tax=Vibrio nigripulchritudo TaxID=28173 RepID=UPI002490A70A|nr:D-threitol dehydrogenase [Vibrio nigripulchritudo]BDU38133.1 D-threitol dehydrogenase [Vibrio nigripulchritudo]BDU43856.1 D-threitol dehydrogenase [Vibrio nigripulchritudo]